MSWIEVINKVLAIIISCSILYNGYLIKKRTGSWFFIGSIISVFWFFFTFFPLLLLFKTPINLLSIAFITLCIVLFSWTHIFFNWNKDFINNANNNFLILNFKQSYLVYLVFGFVILSLISSLIFLNFQGSTLKDYFLRPTKVAENISKKRYSISLIKTNWNALSFVLSNVAVLISGIIHNSLKNNLYKKLIFICFLPSLFILITQSAKGLFFLSIFMFLGGVIVTKQKNNMLDFIKRNLKKSILFLIFIPSLLVFSFFSRGLNKDMGVENIIIKLKLLFSSYILAHLYSFSDWFTVYLGGEGSRTYDTSNNYYGFYTFNAITRYIDPNKENFRGIYNEYFSIDGVIHTNVYTIFRGLIMDFGIFGTFIFVILGGIIANKVYYTLIAKNKSVMGVVGFVFVFSFIYMSFLASLLYWTVTPLSFLLLYLILIIIVRPREFKKTA